MVQEFFLLLQGTIQETIGRPCTPFKFFRLARCHDRQSWQAGTVERYWSIGFIGSYQLLILEGIHAQHALRRCKFSTFTPQQMVDISISLLRSQRVHLSLSTTVKITTIIKRPDETRLIERAAARYKAFRDSAPCHHLPKGTKLELGRGAPGGHRPQSTKPPPRLNRPTE